MMAIEPSRASLGASCPLHLCRAAGYRFSLPFSGGLSACVRDMGS